LIGVEGKGRLVRTELVTRERGNFYVSGRRRKVAEQ
jgi:hypothetical protein